jgi:hypothetical protein
MRIPIVKEYGSWAVFIFSCAAGIATGFLNQPWLKGKNFSSQMLLTVLGLIFLVNAKNPFSLVLRTGGQNMEHILWLVFFSVGGVVLLLPFLYEGLYPFLLFSPLIITYIFLLVQGREHFIISELNGFALLAIPAPVMYFVITGEMSLKLYIAVFIFFAAGVFKVKMLMKKTSFYRWLMAVFCVCALLVYAYFDIKIVILLPLLENNFSVLWMREEKLKTTGNTELIKGVVFTILLAFFWQ